MARRHRLSIVTAQLGSGIIRSPLVPDLVDGSCNSPTPVRRTNRQRTSTVACSRSISSQPMARHSPIRHPVASVINDRSGRSHTRAGSLASSAASQCWRSSAVRARGFRRGVPSIRAVSRTGLIVTAPCRAARRIRPEITIFAVRAPLTVLTLIAANTDRRRGCRPLAHAAHPAPA